jgi:hypothetical protein
MFRKFIEFRFFRWRAGGRSKQAGEMGIVWISPI